MPAYTLLIVGSGPGIALQTALLFASHSFTHIALISRSQTNLSATATTITTAHPSTTISTHPCDVSDNPALTLTLQSIMEVLGGPPEVILFNAANVNPSDLLPPSTPEHDSSSSSSTEIDHMATRLTTDFNTTTTALYTVATTLLPLMLSSSLPNFHPTLLLSSSHIHYSPYTPYFSLSLAKASQFNLAGSLAQVYGPKGVQFSTVVINGIVQGIEGEMGARNIAGVLWGKFEEKRIEKNGGNGKMRIMEVGRVEDFERMVGLRV
jgi:NAD(P)-dependent dehydrogenase (short-subunit alcohol dehydrogenase family)